MKIIRVADIGINEAAQQAALVLRKGGIVLFPTDTLYGLAVDANNTAAIVRLRELKGREQKKPISIIVDSVDTISVHAELIPEAEILARRHLPGALTLVLPGKKHLSKELMLNGEIGVRVPNDSFSRKLASVFSQPFTATSANRSGLPTQDTVAGILSNFGPYISYIDLVIDDGERAGSSPSTVISFKDGQIRILREGAISKETLFDS